MFNGTFYEAEESESEFNPNWLREQIWEEILKSDDLVVQRGKVRNIITSLRVTGSVSFISSICLVIHILRSYEGLKTPYHRLVFGLSFCDMMSSFSYVLASAMVPKELNYFTPGAVGNWSTCSAQGFLIGVGIGGASMYNCSICLYYLSIIKYNKKEIYIRQKLEPWFHGFSIIFPLLYGSLILAVESFTPLIGMCFVTNPQVEESVNWHCLGYEDGEIPKGFTKPCGHGDLDKTNPFISILAVQVLANTMSLILPPIVILLTMVLMYRSVAKVEKDISKYGVNALRLRAREIPSHSHVKTNDDVPTDSEESTRGRLDLLLTRFKKVISCFRQMTMCTKQNPRRSNKQATSKKRAILHMANGYAGAWMSIYVPYLILYQLHANYQTALMAASFTPLQGLLNFLVFMAPKVRAAKNPSKKRGRNRASPPATKLTWRQAFFKAYFSKGSRIDNSRGRIPLTSSRKNGLRKFVQGVRNTFASVRWRNSQKNPSTRISARSDQTEL